MERIIDLSTIKLKEFDLLCLVKEKTTKTNLIMPDSVKKTQDQVDYMTVIAKGSKVEDVELTDIVVKYATVPDGFESEDKTYAVISRNYCSIIVSKDNFKV